MLPLANTPILEPIWGSWNYWYLMLLPLALLTALVYKVVRCEDVSHITFQTLRAFGKLVGAFVACALVLWLIVMFLER